MCTVGAKLQIRNPMALAQASHGTKWFLSISSAFPSSLGHSRRSCSAVCPRGALPPCRLEDINELEQLQSGGHSLSYWLCFKLDFFFSKEYLQPLCPLLCSSSSPTVSAWCGTIITKITGSFFFLADEWAEAGDVLAWPLSSSPSPL